MSLLLKGTYPLSCIPMEGREGREGGSVYSTLVPSQQWCSLYSFIPIDSLSQSMVNLRVIERERRGKESIDTYFGTLSMCVWNASIHCPPPPSPTPLLSLSSLSYVITIRRTFPHFLSSFDGTLESLRHSSFDGSGSTAKWTQKRKRCLPSPLPSSLYWMEGMDWVLGLPPWSLSLLGSISSPSSSSSHPILHIGLLVDG